MPHIDYRAADRLRELREDAGLSQEGLATAIRDRATAEGWFKVHGAVDAFTIRRIEREGHCPRERVRLVLALYFALRPSDIWQRVNRAPTPTARPATRHGRPPVAA